MQVEVLKNFIVFEGLDGAGTSTQAKLLSEKIPLSYLTHEPTDSEIGALIRSILKKEITFTPIAIAHLFVADRAEHLYGPNGIVQKCNNNQIVICDRYLFSSLAYQSLEAPFDSILKINSSFPIPEILFFINTNPDECQRRINRRGENEELFEDNLIQENILNNYLKSFSIYEKYGLKTIFLDGNLPIEDLLEKELSHLKSANII